MVYPHNLSLYVPITVILTFLKNKELFAGLLKAIDQRVNDPQRDIENLLFDVARDANRWNAVPSAITEIETTNNGEHQIIIPTPKIPNKPRIPSIMHRKMTQRPLMHLYC